MENEEWKDIDGFVDIYQVSTLGRVRSLKFNKIKILKNQKHWSGYDVICLKDKNGKTKGFRIHRLMALAFIPNDDPMNKNEIDHIDNDRTNNNLSNLRWVSHSQNNMNRSKQSNNTSGVTGVSFSKQYNKWGVRMKIEGKYTHLGYFKNFDDAVKCRKEAEIKYFGDYAYKNI